MEFLEEDDSVLGRFLGFLARDIADHPERLQSIDAGFVQRLQSLAGGIEVDLDVALPADDWDPLLAEARTEGDRLNRVAQAQS